MKTPINNNNLLKVYENNLNIENLQFENNKFLKEFLDNILYTKEEIQEKFTTKEDIDLFNKLILVPENNHLGLSNWDYVHSKVYSRFFVKYVDDSNCCIMEISFNDTLKVNEKIKLVSSIGNIITIELVFDSERVKKRKEKIKRNKFRFTYSRYSNDIICRRLNQ